MKPRLCIAGLYFSLALAVPISIEVKSLIHEISTDFDQGFSWSSGSSTLRFSVTHGSNWNDYVLQVDGQQFLRLTTDGSRPPDPEKTFANSIPLGDQVSLVSSVANDILSVNRLGYSATGTRTTVSEKGARLASIVRPCQPSRTNRSGFEGVALSSLSQ